MLRKYLSLAVGFLVLVGTSIPSRAADGSRVVYVESPGAGYGLSQERLEHCLQLLAKEMAIDPDALPMIVVMHVSTADAQRAGFGKPTLKLFANYEPENRNRRFYELWLIGASSTYEYTRALASVLEHHFAFGHHDQELGRIIGRVTRYLDATVSAKAR
jgi:hypothetical protein